MDKWEQLRLEFGDEWVRALRRFYPLILGQSWQDANLQLGMALAFDLDNPRVQETLTLLGQRIRAVADTTVEQVQELVGRQAAEGWSLDELAAQLRELAEIRTPERAMLIARTETADAYSRGSLLAYEASGVVSGTEWLVTQPCDQCAPLAGQVRPLGAEFAEGISHPPAHPGCRCALAPVIVR